MVDNLLYINLQSTNDYYPFGSEVSERTYSSDKYKFGFNGQMKDDEINGQGNTYTALFWEYDSRIGRRWNLDPKPTIGICDYACFSNNPLTYTDINGDKVSYVGNENASKIKVFFNVLKARMTDANFRRNFRTMKRDRNDTFQFSVRSHNNQTIVANNPVSIFQDNSGNPITDPWDNTNQNMWSANGSWGQNDGTNDLVHVNWRAKKSETRSDFGAGSIPKNNESNNLSFNGLVSVTTKEVYRSGNIHVVASLNDDDSDNSGQDILTIRQGTTVVGTYAKLKVGQGNLINFTIPFGSRLTPPGAISVHISNPTKPNNSPGACYIRIHVISD